MRWVTDTCLSWRIWTLNIPSLSRWRRRRPTSTGCVNSTQSNCVSGLDCCVSLIHNLNNQIQVSFDTWFIWLCIVRKSYPSTYFYFIEKKISQPFELWCICDVSTFIYKIVLIKSLIFCLYLVLLSDILLCPGTRIGVQGLDLKL